MGNYRSGHFRRAVLRRPPSTLLARVADERRLRAVYIFAMREAEGLAFCSRDRSADAVWRPVVYGSIAADSRTANAGTTRRAKLRFFQRATASGAFILDADLPLFLRRRTSATLPRRRLGQLVAGDVGIRLRGDQRNRARPDGAVGGKATTDGLVLDRDHIDFIVSCARLLYAYGHPSPPLSRADLQSV